MIDIHTHILPGIDDGAPDWEASLAMARAAVAEGITGLVATPHHANGKYDNPKSIVSELVWELQNRLKVEGVPLTVYSGQEIRVHTDLLEGIETKELLSLAGSAYVLLEMPSSTIPERMSEWVYELNLLGVKAIIAHPERNAEVLQHPDRFQRLVDEGAYGQVTTHSLLGAFGKKIESFSWKMCSDGLVHLVSSDAHNLGVRGFRLAEAYEKINQKLGLEYVQTYRNNAIAVIENGEIQIPHIFDKTDPRKWNFFRKLFANR
ncbi:tyrosine-protein phosphatase [Paenibacillus methanolicus]|uniref:Tyrosine-protein phosphatase n=1 Tax=Paenibacillus methanolicus TaxID=582686 RepID=A0A5S5C8C6_9BACL|nr:CpsB/CapC family capsule biosynthesis tyrosine phosphatase [Paenibacillus methanolicus]TYP75655.1 protein-tyrosine phosphatase [Paenibacillus methanolicus]